MSSYMFNGKQHDILLMDNC